MTDDISKVAPFWEWKEKQKAIDAEANGGVPLLRSKDWYHREYGKYVAAIQRQGYASFNKGTLTVDVGQSLKDTRIESAAAPVEVELPEPAFHGQGSDCDHLDYYTADQMREYAATLARQLADATRLLREWQDWHTDNSGWIKPSPIEATQAFLSQGSSDDSL